MRTRATQNKFLISLFVMGATLSATPKNRASRFALAVVNVESGIG